MGSLSDRDRRIWTMREAGATFVEIAERFGISNPRARQIYLKVDQYFESLRPEDLTPESTLKDAFGAYRLHVRTWLTTAAERPWGGGLGLGWDATLAQLYDVLTDRVRPSCLSIKADEGLRRICRDAGCKARISARLLEAKSHEEEEVGKEVLSTEAVGIATDSRRLPLDYQELKLWT